MKITTTRVLNLGAGVQSTRLALMFEQGEILDLDGTQIQLTAAYFADTGDEPGAVYAHLDWLLHRIKAFPIHIRNKGRLSDDLRRGVNSTGQRFASIPAFTQDDEGGDVGKVRRQCSKEYKIDVIESAIRAELLNLPSGGRLRKNMRVIQYLGISMDEIGRATRVMRNRVPTKDKRQAKRWPYPRLFEYQKQLRWSYAFPLIDADITRGMCLDYLSSRVPHQTPRSACVYCPYHNDAEWMAIKSSPEDWALAVEVDRSLRIEGNIVNRNLDQSLYLHRSCQPLELVQLNPRPSPRETQLSMSFTSECQGVCGV
jgi:hypothetical protein